MYIASRHNYVTHHKTNAWGKEKLIMESGGCAFARVYWFNDDVNTIFLGSLSVEDWARSQGIGTHLQEMREKLGRELGYRFSCLWVKKDTWMYDWYKRRGYEDFKIHEEEENAVWMKKQLREA